MSEGLPPGSHLITRRFGFWHHGIYAGGGRVIHYGALKRPFAFGPVEEVSLKRFARKHGYRVLSRDAVPYAGVSSVERARTRLGENRYRLWSNNCEHFVEWCISGNSRSRQVEVWRARFAAVLAALGLRYARFI